MPQHASTMADEKPLQGAVLCCTSIPPEIRTRLTEYAEQMGAEHRLDLTSDVTHLLIGETGTPKYQYVAKEREDVKVLQPEWVEAVRGCWMADKPLDLNALDEEYKVPTLAGLKICITGFDDLSFRAQLQENIKKNGGMYTGDLTKDVTHLIAATAEGKKYEYASLWQKKIVSLKWYKDSLDRGMQLDESCYHPSKPVDEQGIGAWNRQQDNGTSLGKRQRSDVVPQEPSRKLRRTASAKFGSQSDNLWNDIVGGVEGANENRNSLRSAKSMSSIQLNSFTEPGPGLPNGKHVPDGPGINTGVFERIHFVLHGFDAKRSELLQQAITGLGGTIHQSLPNLLDLDNVLPNQRYFLVPHQTKRQKLQMLRGMEKDISVATELWVEWCMTKKEIVPLQTYPLGGVIETVPNHDTAKLLINATGFHSIQTMHISKAIACVGAKYEEIFTGNHSVLICNSSNSNPQKAIHAFQWKVPIVSEKWLWQLITSGNVPPFEPFAIRPRVKPEDDFRRKQAIDSKPTRQKKKSPTPDPSFHTQDTLPVTSKTEQELTPGSPSQRLSQPHGTSINHVPNNMPLKEVSPNLSPKRQSPAPKEGKKKLFRTYDGSSSVPDQYAAERDLNIAKEENQAIPALSAAHQPHDPIADFLQIKAQAAANAAEHNQPTGRKAGQQKLLGRALSNLSNTSRVSQSARQSRASSIDSMNTDGLGTELSNSAIPMFSNNIPDESTTKTSFGLTGRAKPETVKLSTAQIDRALIHAVDLNDPNLLRDEYVEEEHAPQRTQLGYEESDEATAMRELLAERRRARGRPGQQDKDDSVSKKVRESVRDKRVIRDDEALLGQGRRTRQKDKVIDNFAAMTNDFAL